MIPPAFTYVRATSVDEALGLAAEHGEDAKYLAGGHSLLPLMKLRLAAPEVIIDVGGLHDLSFVAEIHAFVQLLRDPHRALGVEVIVQQRIVELFAIQDVQPKRWLIQHQQFRVDRHDQRKM